jgi:hypothetical protein
MTEETNDPILFKRILEELNINVDGPYPYFLTTSRQLNGQLGTDCQENEQNMLTYLCTIFVS